jgi:hypothetical protein
MKKTLFAAFAACVFSAQAQFFTNGNLAVVRIGGPGQSVTTTDSGNAVFIDQYTTNGVLVSSFPIPSNGPNALIMDGNAYDGYMTLTPDGSRLVIGGFNTSAPYMSNGVAANFALASSATVPRAIATVDGYGNYALPIANSNMFNTFTITGVASDGSNYWAQGNGATAAAYGVVYCGTATAPATNEVLTGVVSGCRGLIIYSNSLYSMGYPSNTTSYPQAGAFLLTDNGTSLPTNATTANVILPVGTAAASTPSDLVINSNGTIAYLADYSFGIVKFTNGGSGWVSNYTVYPTNAGYSTASGSSHAISLTADFTQSPPVVYATTGETITNRLVMFQDTGATPTVINLASNLIVSGVGGSTNTFRGLRFAPIALPLIASQPASVVQSAGNTATFTVIATGTPALSYQWYTNGGAVPGATGTSFVISPVTTFQSGTVVDVIVTSPYGTTTSSNAILTVTPNYFIPGNLAVVSVGGPGQTISANGDTVSILQYTTAPGQSAPVSSLPLPSTGPMAFALDNSATEGYMQLTPNGQYLVLGGYNTAIPVSTGVAASTAMAVPRAVVTIDGNGNYAMPIANTNVESASNLRGAVFDGTNNFWVDGPTNGPAANVGGVFYVGTPGSQVATLVGRTGTGNERCLNIYNNTLYVGTGSVNHGIYAITGPSSPPPPTGSPTNPPAPLIAMNSSSSPYDFIFNSASNICYVADSSLGGIVKFTNGASGWVSNYTLSAFTSGAAASGTNAEGVTADFTQNPPVIYATTTEAAGNRLISIVDSGPAASATLLATATSSSSGSNYFRGVRFVPGVVPSITNQPQPFTQDAGGNATFTVGATGTPVLMYQWYTNGGAVVGATSSSLTLNNLTTSQNGTLVSAVVSNTFGAATSSSALLSVQPPGAPLNVSISPASQTVSAGGTATITASAVGTSLTFIWKRNGAQLADGGSVSGSSTATLTISPAFATYNGTYTVIASNSFGTAGGNNSATLTVIDPVIVTQPVGSTNLPNNSAKLTVVAAGAPVLSYQWISNGVPVGGATTSSLSVANSGATASATYYVIVTNGLGNSVTSLPTVVSFTPLLLSDSFSYPNGNLFADAGSPWTDINGTNPELVTNGRVQVSQSNATTDAQSLFSQPEAHTVIWTSFIINLSTLPTNMGGVYFANIEDTTFNFFGRIFTLTSNNPSYTPNITNIAFPGTYRLGIANTQNDSANSSSTGPTAVVPIDLALGIDYQVVYFVDLVNQYSGMAINPASLSDVTANSVGGVSSGPATDAFLHLTNAMAAYGFRQRQGEGVIAMDNLEVSFDWNGTGSGYSAVTAGITAAKPVIGLQPVGSTNYSGNPLILEAAASGIGTAGTGLTYAWYQNGSPLANGNGISGASSQALNISSLLATNSGTYYVVVTGATGGPLQSSNAVVSVNTTTTAPTFTVQPVANTTNSQGGSVTFTVSAVGTGPISYAWYFSNTFGINQVGSTSTLTLSSLSTNQSGAYYAVATGGTGLQTQSSNAVLTVTGPKSVTIGYLRSLLNPTTYAPSDTTTLYNVTGVITTSTNQTTGNTASYYIQDATGGINLFVTDGSDFRPLLGDLVTATGVLSTFADNYELDVVEGGNGYVDTILSHNAPMPTPILFPWGNDVAPLSPFISTNVEGSVVVITNAYFVLGGGTNVFQSGTDYIITNNTGESYTVFVSDQDTNYVAGQPIPAFATSIAGPLIQDNTVIGITFTVYSNLVVGSSSTLTIGKIATAPAPGTGGTNNVTLTWTAVPAATYSVRYSTNLLTPLTNIAASGLTFTNTSGVYSTAATNTATFYQITSP